VYRYRYTVFIDYQREKRPSRRLGVERKTPRVDHPLNPCGGAVVLKLRALQNPAQRSRGTLVI